jgi:cell division protein FtsI/penicillin-binding protein 2
MDKKLKAAIEKGKLEKQVEIDKERKLQRAEVDEHHQMIKSYLPQARKWVNEILFAKIAQAEKEMKSYSTRVISLRDYEDGIPAQAICEAAGKIKGLHPGKQSYCIYENAEVVGVECSYEIRWDADSEDTNNEG